LVKIVNVAVKFLQSMSLLVAAVLPRAINGRRLPMQAAIAAPRKAQSATQMSAEAHWGRVSAVVARSVDRAHVINQQQAAARQQLDAAEYTLHRLIEELNEVMTSPVMLPTRASTALLMAEPVFVQAMAA
jgi:hypothetical protein